MPSDIFTEKLMKDGTLKQIEEEVEEPLEGSIIPGVGRGDLSDFFEQNIWMCGSLQCWYNCSLLFPFLFSGRSHTWSTSVQ